MPKHDSDTPPTTPLLRWAGGKRRLLHQILPMVPPKFRRYYEPFFGGGALFFALQPQFATLSDSNEELMLCYQQVRDSPEDVITALNNFPNTQHDYYRIRDQTPQLDAERAARIMYLTTLSFNGIYRINNSGRFNVPYSQRHHVNPCNPESIRRVSKALTGVELLDGDFGNVLGNAQTGDLIYLDPPYTVAHGNNGFVKYNQRMFHWHDQERLAQLAGELDARGCHLIISNADHASLRELYSRFRIKIISRNSIIAAASNDRKLITECIFHNLEHIENENYAG